ncbi:unnamed protein product [Lathyrus oleraceus]
MQYEYENYDPSFPDQPVVDQYLPLWARLPSFMSKPAFIWAEDYANTISTTHLTYEQLNTSTDVISTQLLFTLQRGDTVLILCSPGLDLVKVIFGCQRAGLLTVPIVPPNPSFANEKNYHHLIRIISQTKPKAAIAHPNYISAIHRYITSCHNNKLAHMLQTLLWISTEDIKNSNIHSNSNSNSYNGRKPDEVYLVQYTSGATGIPKPVLVTTGSAAHNVRTARKAYDLHPNSTIVSWLPQYHDCGLMFLLLTIVSGATCVLASPTSFIKRPRIWLELMSKFNATCTPVPSFTLPLVVKRGGVHKGTLPINLSNLNNLILINEPIYSDSVVEFVHTFSPFGLRASSISPSYGLAENCTFVSTAWRDHNIEAYSSFSHFPTHKKLLPVARLEEQEDMEIMVVNEETLEPVEDGVEGEIWVSSPSNCSGYLGHPSLTREVFHARIRNKVRRCFLRTGDKGIVKGEKRYLYVTGRIQDTIKLQNGEKIQPHYIETAVFNSFPKLLRGGCVAAFKVLATVVIVAEMQRVEKDVDEGILRSVCEGIKESVLKKECVEVGWVVLVKSESVPKTTSGKLQRWAAKEKLLEGKLEILMETRFGKDVARIKHEVAKRVEVEKKDDHINGLVFGAETRSSLISHL